MANPRTTIFEVLSRRLPSRVSSFSTPSPEGVKGGHGRGRWWTRRVFRRNDGEWEGPGNLEEGGYREE